MKEFNMYMDPLHSFRISNTTTDEVYIHHYDIACYDECAVREMSNHIRNSYEDEPNQKKKIDFSANEIQYESPCGQSIISSLCRGLKLIIIVHPEDKTIKHKVYMVFFGVLAFISVQVETELNERCVLWRSGCSIKLLTSPQNGPTINNLFHALLLLSSS